jgi:hypothetical protein
MNNNKSRSFQKIKDEIKFEKLTAATAKNPNQINQLTNDYVRPKRADQTKIQ